MSETTKPILPVVLLYNGREIARMKGGICHYPPDLSKSEFGAVKIFAGKQGAIRWLKHPTVASFEYDEGNEQLFEKMFPGDNAGRRLADVRQAQRAVDMLMESLKQPRRPCYVMCRGFINEGHSFLFVAEDGEIHHRVECLRTQKENKALIVEGAYYDCPECRERFKIHIDEVVHNG